MHIRRVISNFRVVKRSIERTKCIMWKYSLFHRSQSSGADPLVLLSAFVRMNEGGIKEECPFCIVSSDESRTKDRTKTTFQFTINLGNSFGQFPQLLLLGIFCVDLCLFILGWNFIVIVLPTIGFLASRINKIKSQFRPMLKYVSRIRNVDETRRDGQLII